MSQWTSTAFAQAAAGAADVIAIGQWGNDPLSTSSYIGFSFLLFVIIVFGVLIYWSKNPQSGAGHNSKHAENLFLGIKFDATTQRLGQNKIRKKVVGKKVGLMHSLMAETQNSSNLTESSGYLRALALNEASFVSPKLLSKSDSVTLHLDSLPDYPENKARIKGEVFACRPIGGEPESYLIKLKFLEDPTLDFSNLSTYLDSLTGRNSNKKAGQRQTINS